MSHTRDTLVEACVTSPSQAFAAFRAGAERVELCRNLNEGGLTPTRDQVAETVEGGGGPVFVMVRPRGGPFRLAPGDLEAMALEIDQLGSLGVSGVVVGALDSRGRIDLGAVTELVEAAGRLPVTFHRAFDELGDPAEGIGTLVKAGVTRVLTSGGARTAWEGRDTLRYLVQASAGQLTILGGGGVRGDHVKDLLRETGLREIHARGSAIPGITAALSSPGP